MSVESLTPVEAASVLLSTVFGVDYFDDQIERKLHIRRRRPFAEISKFVEHWQGLFQDAQRSQLLVNTVGKILECDRDLWPLNERRFEPNEVRVLRLRYGIEDGQTRPYRIVGEEIGLSLERARQLDLYAEQRLRNPGVRESLTPFLPHDWWY